MRYYFILLLFVQTAFAQKSDSNLPDKDLIRFAKQESYNSTTGHSKTLEAAIARQYKIKWIGKYEVSNQKTGLERLQEYATYDTNGKVTRQSVSDGLVENIDYTYNTKGDLIKKVEIGNRNIIYLWSYDKKGRMIKQIINYQSKHQGVASSQYYYNHYAYNIDVVKIRNKNQIKRLRFHKNGQVKEVKTENKKSGSMGVYRFDSHGKMVYRNENAHEAYYSYVYIAPGITPAQSDLLTIDTTTAVDEHGQKLTKICYKETGKQSMAIIVNKKTIKTLDSEGYLKMIEIYENDVTGNLVSRHIYWYNNQGKVTEKKAFFSAASNHLLGYHNSQGYHPPVDTYHHLKYKYYSNGLQKAIFSYDKNGEKQNFRVEYRIKYYE